MSKVGNPCRTLGQLLASRILYALLVGEKQHEIARETFCTKSCSEVGQLLANSSPTPHRMGSCRALPCGSPLATPDSKRLWLSEIHCWKGVPANFDAAGKILPRFPRGPGDRIFSLERMKKAIPPRTKFSFSLEIFILGLKFSFSIENFNPRPCFSAVREGPGMKKPFSIENFIPC